jgi:hypothetical protein
MCVEIPESRLHGAGVKHPLRRPHQHSRYPLAVIGHVPPSQEWVNPEEGDALPGVEQPASTTTILVGSRISTRRYTGYAPRQTEALVAASGASRLAEPHSGSHCSLTSLLNCLIII